jgi:hypothetical protein
LNFVDGSWFEEEDFALEDAMGRSVKNKSESNRSNCAKKKKKDDPDDDDIL